MRALGLFILFVAPLAGCGGTHCVTGETICGNRCAVVATDPLNCGACGVVCDASSVCSAGACLRQASHLGEPGGGVPANAPVYRIFPGGSTVVQPGSQAGYGITANVGGSYRLVWTGDAQVSGTYHEFWGSVYTPGNFSSIVPGCNGGVCPLQADDQVTNPQAVSGGQRIDFDSIAPDSLNGFDFLVDAEPVYFDILIDGARYPTLVFFPATDNGGQVSNVAAVPFALTTN